MTKVNSIKSITLIITSISLLIGIAIAFFLSYRNVIPIKKMVKMLIDFSGTDSGKNSNDLDFLSGNISSLILNNKHLQDTLNEQLPIIKTAFFDRLVKGEFVKKEDIDTLVTYIGLNLSGKRFLVSLLSLYDNNEILNEDILKETNIIKVFVKNILSKRLPKTVLINDVNENKIALLIACEAADNIEIRNTVQQNLDDAYKEIASTYNLKLRIAFGNIYDSLICVNESFEQATKTLDYCLNNSSDYMVWYSDIPKHSDGFYYPLEQEMRLVSIIKAGNFEEVKQALNNNYTENFVNRHLSPDMMDCLFKALWITVVKLDIQLQLDYNFIDGMYSLDSIKSVDGRYKHILNIYNQMCNAVNNQKNIKNTNLKNDILEYIEAAYTDPNISLSSIASKFGLTEAYISYFFKEQTGENFMSYLTQRRIQHACELLKNPEISIYKIAKTVGYNSDQVFRRAFKRIKDVSPAEFRSIL